MSLFYNNNAGVLLPVSGLNGQSGELVIGTTDVRAGTCVIPPLTPTDTNPWESEPVTFSTPMSDTNYMVDYQLTGSYWNNVMIYVGEKRTTGFDLNISVSSNGTIPQNTLLVKWKAFQVHTATDVTTLQNDVANLQTVTSTTVAVPGGGIRLYKCGRIVQASFQIVGDSLASNFTTGQWVNYGSSGVIPSAYRPISTVYCGQQIVETPVLMRVTTGGNLDYYYSGANISYEYEWTQTWISAT